MVDPAAPPLVLPPGLPTDHAALTQSLMVVELPLTTRFRGITTRTVGLIEGPHGWGEFGAFPEYGDSEAALWALNALELAYQPLPVAEGTLVAVNDIIPALDPQQVAEHCATLSGRVVKIKVAERGESLEDDLARIAAVHAALPEALLRCDANGGYSVDQAVDLLSRLQIDQPTAFAALDYLEQPCASVVELAELTARIAAAGWAVAIAADESIRRSADPFAVVAAKACDRVVLKAPPLGGPRRLAAFAAALALPTTVSSALDSAVGLTAGIVAAAALPEAQRSAAHGLGTGRLFAQDIAEPHLVVDGQLRVERRHPLPELLRDCAADQATTRWWRERFGRCLEYLAAQAAPDAV